MKECYYCGSQIPEDATICPMCGLNVDEIETVREEPVPSTTTTESQTDHHEQKRAKGSFDKIGSVFLDYFSYLLKRVANPVGINERVERHSFYGYISILLASSMASGIITRVVGALDGTYQFLLDISILPTLQFTFSPLEWFWKGTLFFLVYFVAFAFLSYLFRKVKEKEPIHFNVWVTQYVSMSTFYFLLLLVAFLLAMVVPLALSIIVLAITFLYLLSYQLSFLATLYGKNGTPLDNKTFYQGLFGISIHFLVLLLFGYLLVII